MCGFLSHPNPRCDERCIRLGACPGWQPVVLAVALCLAAAPAADAAKKPLRCKAGFGKLTLNGTQKCVRNGQLLPRLPAASSPWLPYLRWAVQQPEQHIFTTKVGGKVVPLPSFGIAAPSVNAALAALTPYGRRVQVKLTGQAAPRRAPPPPRATPGSQTARP